MKRKEYKNTRGFMGRGQLTELPILGDRLAELGLSICQLPSLIFKSADGGEAEITIEDRILLYRGDQEQVLEGSMPGATFDPKALAPLLELLGCEVTDAVAEKTGRLRIMFSNATIFEVSPTHGFEAWPFRYPRPGRPPGDSSERAIALTGAHGRLI